MLHPPMSHKWIQIRFNMLNRVWSISLSLSHTQLARCLNDDALHLGSLKGAGLFGQFPELCRKGCSQVSSMNTEMWGGLEGLGMNILWVTSFKHKQNGVARKEVKEWRINERMRLFLLLLHLLLSPLELRIVHCIRSNHGSITSLLPYCGDVCLFSIYVKHLYLSTIHISVNDCFLTASCN